MTTASKTPTDAFDRFVASLEDARPTSKGVRARCPAHADSTPSLDVDRGDDGSVLISCRSAKCSAESIVKALGLSMSDLFPPRPDRPWATQHKAGKSSKAPTRHPDLAKAQKAAQWSATNGGKITPTKVTRHDYTDPDGTVVGGVFRFDFADRPKELRRFRRDGEAWVLKDIGAPRPLYNLRILMRSEVTDLVIFVEGEKCADRLSSLGFVATTSAGGAHQPLEKTDLSPLAGRQIVILPDNDAPGQSYANAVAAQAHAAGAASVRLLNLSGLAEGEDVYDWAEQQQQAGLDNDQLGKALEVLLDHADPIQAPVATPQQQPPDHEREGASATDISYRLGERDPKSGKLILSEKKTLPTARSFLREFYTINGFLTLHSYSESLWQWQGNRYSEVEECELLHRLQPWLHDALRVRVNKETNDLELIDFESNPSTVTAAFKTICAEAFLPSTTPSPSWLPGAQQLAPVDELLPCKTMTLHIPSGARMAPTPSLFNFNALTFDHDPAAPTPVRWMQFLTDLFGDDAQSIDLLQEWFGYCLTADTSQQKMLLVVGPRRSGKGTMARVLKELVGAGNVVGPTVGSLAGAFGLQSLLGKTLAIVSDSRFAGDDVQILVERLLCISGEDAITVDRKFMTGVTLKLPVRFMFLTNELPRFNDSSTALAGRFLVLRLTNSFYGKEDINLTKDLLTELPGILLWAIQGWQRLRDRRRFVEPDSSREAVQDIEDLSSPVQAFVRERCVVGVGQRILVDPLYSAWLAWCTADGRQSSTTKQMFGRDLAAAVAGVRRRRGAGGTHPFYDGISLKSGATP